MSVHVIFSVIIPTRDRPSAFARCLSSFNSLNYAANAWELIVVNDGGMKSFEGIGEEVYEGLPLRIINVKAAGPSKARNIGAKAARGDYLAFVDDDCSVTSAWLRQFESGFRMNNCAGLGGQLLNPSPASVAAATWEHYLEFLIEFFHDENGNALLLPTNNVAYRRDIFEALGGFDETFPLAAAEDLEFGYRLVSRGFRQQYYPAAQVWHYHRTTYAGYLRQQFRYGRGGFYLAQALDKLQYAHQIRRKRVRRWEFYMMLIRLLQRVHAPLGMWGLVCVTPIVYSLGKHYENCAR